MTETNPTIPARRFRWRLLQYRLFAILVLATMLAVCLAWGLRMALRQGVGADEAAQRIEVSKRISTLISTLDVDPDVLHSNFTSAVHELIAIGPPAIPKLLDVMLVDQYITRRRAITALEIITMQTRGFRLGRGWEEAEGEAKWRQWWLSMGNLRSDAARAEREQAIKKWRDWLDTQ